MFRSGRAAWSARALCCAILCLLPGITAAAPVPQPVFRSYSDEIECLAKAIYFEARGEPIRGQMLVGQVILNRIDSPYYPDSACDVVYENASRKNACQFSFACDGIPDRIAEPRAFRLAKLVAKTAFRCDKSCRYAEGPLAWSTHYHADRVSPWWSRKLMRTGQIGSHVFYFTLRK